MYADRWSSLFWLAFATAIFAGSLRLGVGTLHRPGMGFMTAGASGLLGIFSLMLFVQAMMRRELAEEEPLFAGRMWRRAIILLVALFLYARIMPSVGYLITTFLLMAFLYTLVRKQRWYWVLVSALLTTLATYYLFSKWLGCQFPVGLFAF